MKDSTSNTLALVFEFDDTLAPDSTAQLLKKNGIDAERFWKRVGSLVESGYDPTLAYLQLLLDNIGSEKSLGKLTSRDLRVFGATLDSSFYPGASKLFKDLKQITSEYKGIGIKFYVISSGLQQIIEGSGLIQQEFAAVYASELAGDSNDDMLRYVKRCVTFTEKTRFLFEISKGLDPQETRRNPMLVNRHVPQDERPVPFRNMIYVGDPLTDIPCFSLLSKEGGIAFGVSEAKREMSPKRSLQSLLTPARIVGVHAPRYEPTSSLGSLLRAAVATRCSEIQLKSELVKQY